MAYDTTGWAFNDDGSVKIAPALTFKFLPLENHGIALKFDYQEAYKPGETPKPPGVIQLAISTKQAEIIIKHLQAAVDALNQHSEAPPQTRQ